MWRKIFVGLALVALLAPAAVWAQTDATEAKFPGFNPLCWKEDMCVSARQKIDPKAKPGDEGGWVQEAPCTGEWGKCLPGGVTKTKIGFGGVKSFAGLGDFIKKNYNLAIVIASILAALMVIIAGFQWVMSGGSSEIITSAKKRIGGAVGGLLLVWSTYFILNTINPALVNLRLPQTWMVRPMAITPSFCYQAPSGTTKFAFAADFKDQKKEVKLPAAGAKFDLAWDKVNTDKFYCGHRFFMENGGPVTCFGANCGKTDGSMCVNFQADGTNIPYTCKAGVLAGRTSGSFGLKNIPAIEQYDDIELFAMCNNDGKIEGPLYHVDIPNDSTKGTPYFFSKSNEKNGGYANACKAYGGPAGFFLGVEVNDESGGTGDVLGQLTEGATGSTGADDWFAVGQSAPWSGDCSTNLAKVAIGIMGFPSDNTAMYSCSMISYPEIVKALVNEKDEKVGRQFLNHLISLKELEKGYTCNISISRSEFPAVDNSFTFKGTLTAGLAVGTAAGIVSVIVPGPGFVVGFAVGAVGNIGVNLLTDVTRCTNGQAQGNGYYNPATLK